MEQLNQRNVRLDIIRIFSFLCVPGVHFLLNSGFYTQIVSGKEMLFMCIMRSFFIICVPMFITLTGYLMNKKTLCKKYYKGIFKTLNIYLICSIIYCFFSKIYFKEQITIKLLIKNILSFKGTPYSWYIEMYIGLFLLIPFLNLIFNNLKSKKEAKLLLLTLIFLIGIPGILNIFKFHSLEWWLKPSIENNYMKIVPSWWNSIYPVFYYFLGAYLNKYPIKFNTILNVLSIIAVILLDGLFNFYRSHGVKFIWGIWNSYSSAIVMLSTFLVFNLLLKIKFKNTNEFRNRILKTLSDACLGAYLISYVFDTIFYNKLKSLVSVVKERFVYAPLLIICVFISSIVFSMIINLFYNSINLLINKIRKKYFASI